MTKKFFFLAGMQRSGATVLSAILNQNPEIYTSPASPLWEMMMLTRQSYDSWTNFDVDRSDAITNCMQTIPHAFYADKPAKYIIDKNLNWAGPNGVELIVNYINPNIKIICCVRNVLDVLVSFDSVINSSSESKNNRIDEQVLQETSDDEPMADRRANWLMRHTQDNPIALEFLKAAKNPQYRHAFHFVDYDDLTLNPKEEIKKIYNYLEIGEFNHSFNNIEQPQEYSLNPMGNVRIENLHTIRPTLKKESRKPEDVFQPQTIARYSNLEFWKHL